MFGLGKKDKLQKLKFKILSKDMLQEYKVKLPKEQASSNLKGYRKGKAPLEVIEQYYGEQLRARVIYETMTNEFYKLITEKKISVVGQPAINPLSMDINKDINVELSLFLIVGFCGGFTTFSAFAIDSISLLNENC